MIARRLLGGLTMSALLVAVTACASLESAAVKGKTAPLAVHTAHAALSGASEYVGVYEPGVPRSYKPVLKFARSIGRQPSIVLYYSAWYTPFMTRIADVAHAHGATVLVQIQPFRTPLSQIAAGQYDRWLQSYAAQVRAFGHPVILSFGHEMNGTWYDWGAGHVSPAVFVAAWRHVVNVFRQAGADNVTWLWTVNSLTDAQRSLRPWWPGSRWVNWVGVDGYFVHSTDTFQIVFGNTLAEIRQFTSKPALISETAAGPQPGQISQIQDLFSSVSSDHLLGIVWFDQRQDRGPNHQDWRLEDSAPALAVFRQEVSRLR